jgi:hypothetical protein
MRKIEKLNEIAEQQMFISAQMDSILAELAEATDPKEIEILKFEYEGLLEDYYLVEEL